MAAQYDGKEINVSAVSLGTITVSFTTPLAIGAANRPMTAALPAASVGDLLSARPASAVPNGYDIGAAYCTSNGNVTVIVNHPALVLGGSFSIDLAIIKIMVQ